MQLKKNDWRTSFLWCYNPVWVPNNWEAGKFIRSSETAFVLEKRDEQGSKHRKIYNKKIYFLKREKFIW